MSNDLIALSAKTLARMIRHKETSPLEVTQAFVDRIEKINPAINAMITPMFDQALQDAQKASDAIFKSEDHISPLYGVPVSIKDSFAVAKTRFTAGAVRYRDQVASQDAEAVLRLRESGAIILGKTNCPDLCASSETRNLLFGLTRNPWKLNHSAGGSSGGEAALIAAGGSPLGLGSDIAGSIRLPAAFCGILGFKPSSGMISLAGHLPNTPELISNWISAGPLARYVEDLALAYEILSGIPVELLAPHELKNRKIIVPAPLSMPLLDNDIARSIESTASVLEAARLDVVRGEKMPFLDVAFEFSAIMEREWLPNLLKEFNLEKPINLFVDLISFKKRSVTPSVLAPLITIWIIGKMLRRRGYGEYKNLEKLREYISSGMGRGGMLLLPVFHKSAPRHGFVWFPDGSPTYTSIFNALGFPACTVPVGFSQSNLPVSIQIVGQPDDDLSVLSLAAILEKAFGVMPLAEIGKQEDRNAEKKQL